VTGLSSMIVESIIGLKMSNLALAALLSLLVLVLGFFLDGTSIVLICVPIIGPAIRSRGMDPIWFAMVFVLAIHIGQITPPVGFTAYAAKGVAEPDVSLEDVFRGCLPFFVAALVAQVIIILFPWLSTILPSLMVSG
jgi:C4-dicarboxylate transporter DctM subunit